MFYCSIVTCAYAIPKEFNLRENDLETAPNLEIEQPTDDNGTDQLPKPETTSPKIIPSRPDGMMLHSTELQISPQRPKVPPKPKRPDTPPPDPLPQFQEDRQSSSPY